MAGWARVGVAWPGLTAGRDLRAIMGRMSSLPDLETPASPPSAVAQRAVPDDLSLLRAYEPILRFTEGELFFPTAVGPYIARCSLWASDAKGQKSGSSMPGN